MLILRHQEPIFCQNFLKSAQNLNFQPSDGQKKNAQNQRAKRIFWKWVKLLLYNFGLFQQVFENLKLNKLVKEERRLDLEDRIWRLKFGTNAVLKLHFEEWIWKLVLFERLAFISLGFGRGAQVGKTSLLEVEFIYGASVDVGRIHFFIWYASGPGIQPKPSIFWKKTPHFFFTLRSEDSETAHLLGSGRVLRHNNACVRDVLTATSNVYVNLGLNLFHSYF